MIDNDDVDDGSMVMSMCRVQSEYGNDQADQQGSTLFTADSVFGRKYFPYYLSFIAESQSLWVVDLVVRIIFCEFVMKIQHMSFAFIFFPEGTLVYVRETI